MTRVPPTTHTLRIILMTLLLLSFWSLVLSGCAAPKTQTTGPVFFPPPPNEPRIQFLTGISSSADVQDIERQGTFSLVLTGKEGADLIQNLAKSYGIVVRNGKIYLCESSLGGIIIIDPVRKTFDGLKGNMGPGALKTPVNLAFDKEGFLYVADTGRREIVVYDPAGNYLKAFRPTREKSKYVSVAAYGDDLFVLDLIYGRIRVLDRKNGDELSEFGYSEQPNQSLRFPVNFTFDSVGNIYVTNVGNGKVMKYDRDGNFLGSFGRIGDVPGEFARPKGIAVDHAGRIYVVDSGLNIVQLFDDQFRLLTFFGWSGLPAGSLNLPAGIATSVENLDHFQKFAAPGFQLESLIFVVNQEGTPRISVYGMGEMTGEKKNVPAAGQDKGAGQ